jgi:hypothetical protein
MAWISAPVIGVGGDGFGLGVDALVLGGQDLVGVVEGSLAQGSDRAQQCPAQVRQLVLHAWRRLRVLRVPINHPSRSSRMLVLPEDTTESIMSTDVESRDLGSVGTWNGKRTERGCLSKGPVRSVFVVEDLELAQGMQ